MRQWENRPLAVMDLKRALEESTSPTLMPMTRDWKKLETLSDIKTNIDLFLSMTSHRKEVPSGVYFVLATGHILYTEHHDYGYNWESPTPEESINNRTKRQKKYSRQ